MPWQDAIQILMPIADALGYAHKHNIIHRDVKPANILVTENGQPMLADFGVAKLLEVEETMELTGTGVGIGTPEYMAPEQATNKLVDARADIYALGVVFYEMVTGRKPFIADTPMATLIMHARDPLPRPRQFVPDLPQSVENILLKALAKDPQNRFQSMDEFAKALEGALGGRKFNAPRSDESKGRAKFSFLRRAAIVVGLIALGLGVFAIFSKPLSAQWLVTPTPSNTPILAFTSTPIFTPTPTLIFVPVASPTPMRDIGSTFISDGLTMMYVPAGTFSMGSEKNDDEKPIHSVYLDAYYIDKFEVTNAAYKRCADSGKCTPPGKNSSFTRSAYYTNPEFDEYPVIYVDWIMAKTYCEWRGARLPTEAEWEKAARGTDGRMYPWGEKLSCDKANYDNRTGNKRGCGIGDTSKVGSYFNGVSPYGLYDMAGNVLEWVNDWYSETYYKNSPTSNPLGPSSGTSHVRRGGSWYDWDNFVRSAARFVTGDGISVRDDAGFRCARGALP
jgi:serine/threonine-protein kinase